jgi:hypothetical protein
LAASLPLLSILLINNEELSTSTTQQPHIVHQPSS